MTEPLRVLFVCLGNICRSPTAEGVFRARAESAGLGDAVEIDSAGTGDWHVGSPPDIRAQVAAFARGVDIQSLRARQVTSEDFDRFDLVLAMDRSNLAQLEQARPAEARADLRLFLSFAPAAPVAEVPDPYYGERDGFQDVLDLIEAASDGLIADIQARRS